MASDRYLAQGNIVTKTKQDLALIRSRIWRLAANDKRFSVSGRRGNGIPVLIGSLESYIRKYPQHRLSLPQVAFIFGFEASYCSKVFKKWTGSSYCAWDREIRIRIAKRLLSNTDLPVSTVASSVGYADVTTFERNFKAVDGLCPRAFRAKGVARPH